MSDTNRELIESLKTLVSESQNEASLSIDLLDNAGILAVINSEDKKVTDAIAKQLDAIAAAVDLIVDRLKAGGRLIYTGAGTSGRMGVLDAVECVPTFGVDEETVTAVMAGGEAAMFRAQEGAEDDPLAGQMDLEQLALSEHDVVVGIAASGRTPYVIGALDYARTKGAGTISLSCNANALIANDVDVAIAPIVGPEVVTGSTRMKAGTAQKLVLNMLSTASMIRLGKTYHNFMVDLKTTNEKLMARGTRMLMEITGVTQEKAEETLSLANHRVKTAIYMILADVDPDMAEQQLADADGFLRKALQNAGIAR